VKDQPVVSVPPERLGNDPVELRFDLIGCFSRSQPGSVADPEDMGIDRKSLLAKGGVEDDVGGLPAYSGKCLQLLTRPRDFASKFIDERLA
jgi:hypothetical protein